MPNVTVSIPDDEYETLRKRAEALDIPVDEAVRNAVINDVRSNRRVD